jgi:photosystem II stability/assembly factor-like uncharacterized protein
VLKKSDDGGATWADKDPDGLPSKDVHGFAVDPDDPQTIYAAIAGEGLYRSNDGGVSFEEVSSGVGPAVYGLAVTPDGRLLAAQEGGLYASDDSGTTWNVPLEAVAVGVAVSPEDADTILVTTATGIVRSTDGGATWDEVQPIPDGAWPVTFAPSEPERAYVVGFDRQLYRSDDSGATWRVVS